MLNLFRFPDALLGANLRRADLSYSNLSEADLSVVDLSRADLSGAKLPEPIRQASRKYIVGVVAFVMLVWGPLFHEWPAGLAIRTGSLILVPLATWFLLARIWKDWQPDAETEGRIERSLGGATAGAVLVLAFLAPVGSLADKFALALLLVFLAAGAFWFSISKD